VKVASESKDVTPEGKAVEIQTFRLTHMIVDSKEMTCRVNGKEFSSLQHGHFEVYGKGYQRDVATRLVKSLVELMGQEEPKQHPYSTYALLSKAGSDCESVVLLGNMMNDDAYGPTPVAFPVSCSKQVRVVHHE
jgi:hypothetical protein